MVVEVGGMKRTVMAAAASVLVAASVVAIVVYWGYSGSGSPSISLLIKNLRFDNPPPFGTTSKLTFSVQERETYFRSYGAFYGEAEIKLNLPEGFTTENDNTIRTENLIWDTTPKEFTWEVTPTQTGEWIISVYLISDNWKRVDGKMYPAYTKTTFYKQVKILVSENSAQVTENNEETEVIG